MKKQKFYNYTWDQFDADMCIARINLVDNGYKHIVALVRGGAVIATVLSHQLGVNVYYLDPKNPPYGDELGDINWEKDKILIVDDINDTGHTIENVKSLILNSYVGTENDDEDYKWESLNIDIFTIFEKSTSITKTSYSVRNVKDEWVVFPWENPFNNI